MENIKLIENELNGKKIAYHSESVFELQIGKNKGAYKTTHKFTGILGNAIMHFNMLNVHNGYKKRLVCWTLNKPILARVIT